MTTNEQLPRHSCRPRCCDFCEKRGTAEKPLERWFVRRGADDMNAPLLTGGSVLALWLHNECTTPLMENGSNIIEMFQPPRLLGT